jgi:hypothetical protein
MYMEMPSFQFSRLAISSLSNLSPLSIMSSFVNGKTFAKNYTRPRGWYSRKNKKSAGKGDTSGGWIGMPLALPAYR